MNDIFDEANDILNEIDEVVSGDETSDSDLDSTFNEAELDDIMAEIESFEEEFSEIDQALDGPEVADEVIDEVETEALAEAVIEKMPESAVEVSNVISLAASGPVVITQLQAEIDDELEMMLGEMIKDKAPTLKIAPAAKSAVSSLASNSEISFEAHGQMALNLGFKIGEEEARLIIDPVKGLTVSLSGVELIINLEEGCSVTMINGVKFTIPLTSPLANLKNKAA